MTDSSTSESWFHKDGEEPIQAMVRLEVSRSHARQFTENKIKDYSQWPTVPQLYVNGEFVGGSDIMMEMYESGEMQQLLGGKPA